METFRAMAQRLPDRRKVAVSVEPSLADLAAMNAAGFDYFQIHFRHDLPVATVASWAESVGGERLWLAPKLPPEVGPSGDLLAIAKFILIDTFQSEGFGGTGRTGDWSKFARLKGEHADKNWILAGGLTPENIGEAVHKSGTNFVDVNSGVESAPGVKDHEKLKRFVENLHVSRG